MNGISILINLSFSKCRSFHKLNPYFTGVRGSRYSQKSLIFLAKFLKFAQLLALFRQIVDGMSQFMPVVKMCKWYSQGVYLPEEVTQL